MELRDYDSEEYADNWVPAWLKQKFPNRMSLKVSEERRARLNASNFPSEAWFEKILKKHGFANFCRNRCLSGRFFGDFVFRRERVIVEIDGKEHFDEQRRERDYYRDAFLHCLGWKVQRIPWFEKIDETEIVALMRDLLQPPPEQKKFIRIPKEEVKDQLESGAWKERLPGHRTYKPKPVKLFKLYAPKLQPNGRPMTPRQRRQLLSMGIEFDRSCGKSRAAVLIKRDKKRRRKEQKLARAKKRQAKIDQAGPET